jgi:hypothetical protein
MSEPPTMLIREPDDDRTLIDPRFSAPSAERRFERSGRAVSLADRSSNPDELAEGTRSQSQRLHAMLSGRRRRIVETAVALALAFGLGSVAYQQRRAASALHDVIEEMKVSSTASRANAIVPPGRQARTPISAWSGVETSIPEIQASEREDLEHRGASLIGSNNFAGALAHYQRLTELFPKEVVFGDVVTVLQAKLRCAPPGSSLCP